MDKVRKPSNSEDGYEASVDIENKEFLHKLNNYQLRKKGSAPWSCLEITLRERESNCNVQYCAILIKIFGP
jgi:hypothetical protein